MSAYYTMNPADLPALLTAWQSGSRVLCPCKEQDGTTRLESFVPAKGLCLDYTNLAMPPVDVLNGYQDVLFRWEGNERTYVAEPGAEAMAPTVIFGMRPCDVSALEYLDDFYLGEYRDINYSMRREAVTIVGMNCRTPGKSCFCAATGTGPFARSGFDLMLTLDGDLCWVECATDKGESLVGQAMVFFRPVTEAALRARLGELEKDCRDSFQKLPDLSQIRTALLQGFDHPVWEEITPTCIRCRRAIILRPMKIAISMASTNAAPLRKVT